MRMSGYYWVKYKPDEVGDSEDPWNIRYYSDGIWHVPDYDYTKDDSFFEEIDENRIEQ
jgi:C1A family cysteine protease